MLSSVVYSFYYVCALDRISLLCYEKMKMCGVCSTTFVTFQNIAPNAAIILAPVLDTYGRHQPHRCHTSISRAITINLCSCKFCMFSELRLCHFFHQCQQSQREIHFKGKRQSSSPPVTVVYSKSGGNAALRHVGNGTILFMGKTRRSTSPPRSSPTLTVQSQKWMWQGHARSLEDVESHSGKCGRFPTDVQIDEAVW